MSGMGWWLGVLLLLVLAGAAVAVQALGAARWAQAAALLAARLDAARLPCAPGSTGPARGADRAAWPARYDARELAGLPAPVQRYFRAVLQDGQPIITAASLQMTGRFNLSATGQLWRPFKSHQRVSTRRPGFLWNARIALLPGLHVRVVDSYIAGLGGLHAAVQGLFTVAQLQGEGDIAHGEFMRYFAETPWYPTALLPSQGVQWTAVDDVSATATLADGGLSLSLLFRFNSAGLIESFRAEARGGMVGQVMVQAPWEGRFSDYQAYGGMRVPFAGEVAWMRPQGRQVYFKGRVTALGYEFCA